MDCSVCGGTGLLPFVKDGKVIPHAFVFCECREDEPPNPYQPRPEDFDWPTSHSFYRSLCHEHGWPDPGPTEVAVVPDKSQPQVVEHIHRHSDMGKKEFDLLQQTARKVGWLAKKQERKKPAEYF